MSNNITIFSGRSKKSKLAEGFAAAAQVRSEGGRGVGGSVGCADITAGASRSYITVECLPPAVTPARLLQSLPLSLIDN